MKVSVFKAAVLAAWLVVAGPALAVDGGGDNTVSEPPVSDIPPETAAIDRNPSTGRLTIAASVDNMALGIVVDRATDSYYISANGQTVSYTIPQMAQMMAGGDQTRADGLVAMVRGSLSRMDGFAGYQIGNEAFINRGGDVSTLGGPMQGSACSFSPCTANWVNGYGTNYRGLELVPPWNPNSPPDLSGYSPEIIAYDKERFLRRQETECGNRAGRVFGLLAKAAGTTAACAFAETGFGGVLCGIGVGETVRDVVDDSDVDLCGKQYPGPGRWEE